MPRGLWVTVPGPLPKFERCLAWSVWLFHSISAFFLAAWVSHGKLRVWLEGNGFVRTSGYSTTSSQDLSDPEWLYYRQTLSHLLLSYSIHSTAHFFARKLLAPNSPLLPWLLTAIGFASQIFMTSWRCVGVLYLFTATVTWVTVGVLSNLATWQKQAATWIFCIVFITRSLSFIPFTPGGSIFYREFNLYLYGAFKILSHTLYIIENRENPPKLHESLQYFAYLPYSMTLIVTFADFLSQTRTTPAANPRISRICRAALRLIFWYFAFEALLHVVHVNAIFAATSPGEIFARLNVYEIASIAYCCGQLFHVKYVIIFGVPAFFARELDGMRPPCEPICISRVSLYSRMWRFFDNGLYNFLKTHVYIPVMSKPLPMYLSILRSLSALIAVFSVVLAWHGAKTHYICWVSLSAAELIIERIGYAIWKMDSVQQLRARLGEHCCRRVMATGMLLTVTPGIFGVFFFLGQPGVGQAILDRIVIQGMRDVFTGNLSFSP
ncbi:unnamed protein product [Caenorhabditis angaria]|uniref:Uncharacterized protein n=1 Tax=Caenorhabditis angaria TaxID=860376 RepID=A0A9P1IMD4_9PELO|nr:unnamed protein product [Caenorhabditis angaria]